MSAVGLPTPEASPQPGQSPAMLPPPTTTSRADKRMSGGASHYPTPPPSAVQTQHAQFVAGRHNHMPSIQGQLEIPPYNPSGKRRPNSGSGDEQLTSPTPAPAARRPTTGQHRPVSAQIIPQTPDSGAYTASAHTTGGRHRDRAGHEVQPIPPRTTTGASAQRGSVASTIPHGYHAAGQRQRVYFGPYQLMQTLGEGEFGKVKLGQHGERWGEEVAIKLIKRGSVQESQTRMTKVAREIDVLKIVRHPNIVRLQDVIETEKYIGIVLEYASGGELFDHILAHRYLKERDACKLFAQLVSGVSYLHAKKIVHRDLKLENLLLDRNRNIIITDFGFANRFEDKADDLMATSCGSPCYAAPELVVQDGKYVGSAVDVWSCGVILYAMLAGYLPFDDDPANPEGDNINLLYKYIINTPLSFPEWIGTEPRDLLLRMLVPDPMQRCTLADVARHPWLRRYVSLFSRTVIELERLADQAEADKQAMLERQRQAYLQQHEAKLARSNSVNVATRHQSAVIPVSATSDALFTPPAANTRSNRRAHAVSAIVTSGNEAENEFADPSGLAPMAEDIVQPASAPMTATASAPGRAVTVHEEPSLPPAASTRAAEAKRRKQQAHRYTVQVEYDPGTSAIQEPPTPVSASSASTKGKERAQSVSESPIPPAIMESPREASPAIEELSSAPAPAFPPRTVEQVEAENAAPLLPPQTPTSLSSKDKSTPATPTGASSSLPFPPTEDSTPRAAKSSATSAVSQLAASVQSADGAKAPSTSSKASRHRKGMSQTDKFFRLLGSGSQTSIDKTAGASGKAIGSRARTDSTTTDASGLERKSGRRKALSMVVEPFKQPGTPRSRKVRPSDASVKPSAEVLEASRLRESVMPTTPPPRESPTQSTASQQRQSPRKPKVVQQAPSDRWNASSAAMPPSAAGGSKAKRVMDWFRWRSLNRDVPLTEASPAPIVTDFDRPPSPVVETAAQAGTPTVVVTGAHVEPEPRSVPSSRSASGAQSEVSEASTAATTVTAETSVNSSPPKVANKAATPSMTSTTVTRTASRPAEAFSDNRLRYHQGAVDQNALSSRSPPAIIVDIRRVLWEMGMDVREEAGTYRLKCIRRSQKKVSAQTGIPLVSVQTGDRSSMVLSPSMTVDRLDGRGLPVVSAPASGLTASPSSTFRSLFGRRGSSTSVSQQSSPATGSGAMPSPALSVSTMAFDTPQLDSLASPLARSTSTFGGLSGNQPLPFYGEDDSGAEIRFSVELSRMKNLSNLYSVDIRRLKGELWAYRGIYNALLERLA